MAYACPACGAGAGEQCIVMRGRRAGEHMTYWHESRVKLSKSIKPSS